MSAKKKTPSEAPGSAREPAAPQRRGALARLLKGPWLALWAVILLGAFAAQAITGIAQKNATFDESIHLPAGYTYLKTGDFRLNSEHPPLAKAIAALPLLFVHVDGFFQSKGWQDGDEWRYGWQFLYSGANDAQKLLFFGRLAMVGLSLCLGALIFFWARKIFGNGAGLFALFLFAFCPNLIAHGSLTNTDLAVAFFMLLALFCFDKALRRLTPVNAALAGLTLGLALLAKFTAPLLLPIMFVVALVRVFDKTPLQTKFAGLNTLATWRGKALALIMLLAVMCALAYATLWAGYLGRFSARADGQDAALKYGRTDDMPPSAVLAFLREHRLLPQAYIDGFHYVQDTSARPSFLDGRHNWTPPNNGDYEYWPQYFVMTTLYKTPVPTLIFFLVAAAGAYWLSRKTWRQEVPLIAGIVIYFGVASFGNMNIGHRHILPVIPLAFIFISKIASHLRVRGRTNAITLGVVFAMLLAWNVYGTLSIHPDYLAYFNEIAGGPEHGAEHLTDSNIDWGQDLMGLKKYMDEHHIDEVTLIYAGSADPRYYGVNCRFFFNPPPYEPNLPPDEIDKMPDASWVEYTGIKKGDYIAVSVTHLYETTVQPPKGSLLETLWEQLRTKETPVAKIGYSIYVYRSPMDIPSMSAMSGGAK